MSVKELVNEDLPSLTGEYAYIQREADDFILENSSSTGHTPGAFYTPASVVDKKIPMTENSLLPGVYEATEDRVPFDNGEYIIRYCQEDGTIVAVEYWTILDREIIESDNAKTRVYQEEPIVLPGMFATGRESYVRDSIKKYFVDALKTVEGIEVSFDKTLTNPKVQGIEIDRWYSINIGELRLGTVAEIDVSIFCCTKKDSEGVKLAKLRDIVLGYLVDLNQTDCTARIPLYMSSATEEWLCVGTMLVFIQSESPQMEGADKTKFKVIVLTLKWGSRS